MTGTWRSSLQIYDCRLQIEKNAGAGADRAHHALGTWNLERGMER
jgi:hypothetical protein